MVHVALVAVSNSPTYPCPLWAIQPIPGTIASVHMAVSTCSIIRSCKHERPEKHRYTALLSLSLDFSLLLITSSFIRAWGIGLLSVLNYTLKQKSRSIDRSSLSSTTFLLVEVFAKLRQLFIMGCCRNCIIHRRRLLAIAAAIVAYAAVMTTASSSQATAHAALYTPPSPHTDNNSDDESTTVPTFSCGSQWQSATQCNQLCVDGNDASCPTGQYCYAGIPCSKSTAGEAALRMEEELMERLIRERDATSVKRFVCGVTFEEAELSCRDSSSGPVHYCNSGQSSECPSDMQCFASVACSSSGTSSSSSPSALLLSSSQKQQQQQPIISFSNSPTTNVTPMIHHENDNDETSLSYYYSLNTIVGTMGSKIVEFAGSTFTVGIGRH